MKAVIDWLKAHIVLVAVSAVSVISLALLVLAIMSSETQELIDEDTRLLTSLRSVKPINQDVLQATETQQEFIARLIETKVQEYANAAQRDPLHAPVFSGVEGADRDAAIYELQDKYSGALRELLTILNAKDAPTDGEYEVYEERALSEYRRKQRETRTGLDESIFNNNRRLGGGGEENVQEQLSKKARIDLSVMRAQWCECYANMFTIDDRSSEIQDAGVSEAAIDEIWYAQVALWIQQNVFQALADLNTEAASQLPEQQQWVAFLPVKHVLRFRLGNYLPLQAGAATGGRAGSRGSFGGRGRMSRSPLTGSGSGASGKGIYRLLSAGPDAAFTGRGSTASVDVIRFSLDVVVDAKYLVRLINSISNAGFYTLLDMQYQDIQVTNRGPYVYGPEPTLLVSMVFEACMMRNSYEQWMPETIKTAIESGSPGGAGKLGNLESDLSALVEKIETSAPWKSSGSRGSGRLRP